MLAVTDIPPKKMTRIACAVKGTSRAHDTHCIECAGTQSQFPPDATEKQDSRCMIGYACAALSLPSKFDPLG